MACEHKRLRCTNGIFYCLDCGVELPWPTKDELFPGAKEVTLPPLKTSEPEAKPLKRRTQKGATKA